MNTGNSIQINAPEFDMDVDGGLSTTEHEEIQGSVNPLQHLVEETTKSEAPASPQQVEEEVDWPDAEPVEIPPQSAQDNKNNISLALTWPEMNYSEIPQLESDITKEEEGQFEDIQTYLDHHNTYQESQNIHKEYTKRLLDLDDERYYRDIDHVYDTYTQDQTHIPVIQIPTPHHMMQNLYTHVAEEEDKPAEINYMGTDPWGPTHDHYRAGLRGKSKKTECMRHTRISTKTLSHL